MNFLKMLSACFALLFFPLQGIEKHDPFIVVTPPKAGTHLLTKAMEQLTGRKCKNIFGSYVLSYEEWATRLKTAEQNQAFIQIHARPKPEQISSLKKLGYKVIFLIRDPRDQAISLLHYIDDSGWVYGKLSRESEPYCSLSFDDKLHEIITGKRTRFCALKGLFVKYLPWIGQKFVLTVRFEDLVGKEGGGSRKQQLQEIARIAKFLNMDLTKEQLEERSRGLFGQPGVKTFRKGQIGEWREVFKLRHLQAMDIVYGPYMRSLGYIQ